MKALSAMTVCTICWDDYEAVVFHCTGLECEYKVCESCIRIALNDASGASVRNCPMCGVPTAVEIVEALCGKGGVREVERAVRSKVEFDVKLEHGRKERARTELRDVNDEAIRIFNGIAEAVLMKCPRCTTPFRDYDGCNALRCGKPDCGAAFCAVCLKDCGTDAHAHAGQAHGDLFDKDAFEESRVSRERAIIDRAFFELSQESFDLKQLVKNHVEKAGLGIQKTDHDDGSRVTAFVESSRRMLNQAVRTDRRSILSDPDCNAYTRRGLDRDEISPRALVPDDYRLLISRHCRPAYRVTLEQKIRDQWRSIDLESKNDDRLTVDCLVNVKQALQCAVIAVEGETQLYQTQWASVKRENLEKEEISISLLMLNSSGDVMTDERRGGNELRIIGLNPNLRMMLLQRHINETPEHDLVPTPLKHLLGFGKPLPLFSEILTPVPDSFESLNEQQKGVAHPLSLKTVMEVAGPPGTGKTKTIIEVVRGLLECTDKDTIVLSERNGAIDAIAEKFADVCLRTSGSTVKGVIDVPLWMNVMAYGAAEAMGPSAKLFTLDEKMRYHPELVDLREKIERMVRANKSRAKQMRTSLADLILNLKKLPEGGETHERSELIRKGEIPDIKHPFDVFTTVQSAHDDIGKLLARPQVKEEDVENLVLACSSIISKIIPIREEKKKMQHRWDWERTRLCLNDLYSGLTRILSEELFNEGILREMKTRERQAMEACRSTEERLRVQLPRIARLHMSTIGSSHKLPVADDEKDDLIDAMGGFKIDDEGDVVRGHVPDTIVVFDESGCIPAYELLGLTRLGRNIVGMLLVGDKKQLPPYDPSQGRGAASIASARNTRGFTRRNSGLARQSSRVNAEKIKSLLDVSVLAVDDAKIKLTTQYRVPRDIADLLNDRIYMGDYVTSPYCKAPEKGFHFVHVATPSYITATKYVNVDEIEYVVELVRQHKRKGYDSIMILTPYKKQQRQIQFKLKSCYDDVSILTIDQCQGQEADIVILSLVQKPTRFLNKNRLNVALSRCRRKLFFLTDRRQFREAASNRQWDCALLAEDLLELGQCTEQIIDSD